MKYYVFLCKTLFKLWIPLMSFAYHCSQYPVYVKRKKQYETKTELQNRYKYCDRVRFGFNMILLNTI